ncbi:MAG: pullulanase-type alpha-1,6-glucosidase [Acidobacteriota bacterium]
MRRLFSNHSRSAWLLAGCLAALLLVGAAASLQANPASVAVAGSLQDELGCSADWTPDCTETRLTLDEEDDVWQGIFNVPAGDWDYKAPLNGSWDENYGLGGVFNGDNIPLSLTEATDVKFFYDHKTNWVTDNVNSTIATAAGSFQDVLGCSGPWQPWCLRSWMQDADGDGIYTFETEKLPAGEYAWKVALNESWDVNFGQGGALGGADIPFNVANDCEPTRFSFNTADNTPMVETFDNSIVQPDQVIVPGNFQEELGCPGDWQPDCAVTGLAFDEDDQLWQGVFSLPAGDWNYKVAINGSWDENYGINASFDGPDIPLSVPEGGDVKFYYSHETNWVADNVTATIATLAGSFQQELGCPEDWQPWCLRSWLQDPDGDGIYTFTTTGIPAGSYETKVAINEDWAENYGLDGALNGANIPFTVPTPCTEMFFAYDATSNILTISSDGPAGPQGNLNNAEAYWVDAETLAWNSAAAQAAAEIRLYYSDMADITLGVDGINGGQWIALSADADGLSQASRDKFPHLAGQNAFNVADGDLAMAQTILRGQIAAVALDAQGEVIDATSVQIPGALDDLFTYGGDLGATFAEDATTVRVWAPTAQSVNFHLFADADPATTASLIQPMTYNAETGVWMITGDPAWKNQYYLFEVQVYAPETGAIETNIVTDPYSLSLSANSQRSQLIDLSDPAWMPSGWMNVQKPALPYFEDIVLYELHVRDFSWQDDTVSDAVRGTFKAFTEANSNGMNHLKALGAAGLTHVHLLPSFDIATVEERRELQVGPEGDLSSFGPDSEEQQARIAAIQDQDGFNWGYDPWHYTVPEGSYATNPDGATRIVEFREMVQSLNQNGLRVVMDVVYNHTNAGGQNPKSVLDRIVPGYYHRLNATGDIEQSTCCPNTASEHAMMEKLMVDSLVVWAKYYKVDGFRFDLMGHHMKSNMLKVREALDALTLAEDGIDGSKIYVYGEGWNFGEVANGARGENGIQANMAGTGIGTFNDRLRDGARGGGPFSGLQEQGFLTGLFVNPNATDQGTPDDQLASLLGETDWVRAGMAGNLRDYVFVNASGEAEPASAVDYNGQQAGYVLDPQETINYVAAHDNETLFDAIQFKVPVDTSSADRARIQNLGVDVTLYSQGVPFIHAGMDMLRSKSLDRDSFNSGDWFNKLDFTYQSNNWGVGLPVASKNLDNWPLMQPLLADPGLAVTPTDIQANVLHTREALRVRKSTQLFRLQTGEAVQNSLRFLNTGPNQVPGVIAMLLSDTAGAIDPAVDHVMVVFNARPDAVSFTADEVAGVDFVLHPVLQQSADPIVRTASYDAASGTFNVPAFTTGVFWAQAEGGGGGTDCVPDSNTLCLNADGRFAVSVDWETDLGTSGKGNAVDIGLRDSGVFTFFNDDNAEMLVKVLDGCSTVQNSFWVFVTAATNVAFNVEILDTQTGAMWTYENPQGRAAPPIQDTSAFQTCP